MPGLSVNTLISDLRSHLGVEATDTGWDDAGCLKCLNRPYWEFFNQHDLHEAEVSAVITTVNGQTTIPLLASFPNLEAIRQVTYEDLNSKEHIPLTRMDPQYYQDNYVNSIDAYGIPTHYMRIGNNIVLWPTPNNVYNITVDAWQYVNNDLAAGGQVGLVNAYHQAILYGAVAIGKEFLGDLDGSSYFKREFRIYKKELKEKSPKAKEEENSPHAGLNVIQNIYGEYNM